MFCRIFLFSTSTSYTSPFTSSSFTMAPLIASHVHGTLPFSLKFTLSLSSHASQRSVCLMHDSTCNPDSDIDFNKSDDEYSSSNYTSSDNDNNDDDSIPPAPTNVQTLPGLPRRGPATMV